jgi:hypothetical protein
MAPLHLSHFPNLLGLDDDASNRAIYRTSMSPRAKLLEVFLSVLHLDGHEIGPVGRAHLDMARQRAELYRGVADRIRAAIPAAVALKGAAIAQLYPSGVQRSSVDLDVYLPTPDLVWQAAVQVSRHEPIREANVSVRRTPNGHDLFVGLTWDCPLSIVDPVYRVELSTLPFLGDGDAVPARAGLPTDPTLRQLLLVAEEQFQRPVIGRDIVDAAILLSDLTDPAGATAAHEIARWRLAPEVRDLCVAVDRLGLCDSGTARILAQQLASGAETEITSRQGTYGAQPVVEYGLALDTTPVAPTHLQDHEFGTVLYSPLGTYLLVNAIDVDPETYLAACTAVGVQPDMEAFS